VKVEPTLQLPGQRDIFAIGDIIDWDEQKQLAKAHAHAEVVIPNVIALLNDQSSKLKAYKGTVEYLALINGSVSLFSYTYPHLNVLLRCFILEWRCIVCRHTRRHCGRQFAYASN